MTITHYTYYKMYRSLVKYLLLFASFALLAKGVQAQNADFHVVPLPKEVKATGGGNFVLTGKTIICYPESDKKLRKHAQWLAQYVEQATGLKLQVTNLAAQRNCIRLVRSLKSTQKEVYRIRVNGDIVLLDGASEAGLFYAVQTFRKALPVGKVGELTIPAVEVNDHPRFSYRGAHLDVARHFFPADSVRRFIDMLALHGINRFHWHLTDDQGWRIEIKKYPRLTSVGSKRAQTVIGHNTPQYDNTPYGGYFTQKEIKEIVRYAEERYITIIPEIDMPGHMQAALAAYPELGCTGEGYKVWERWGVSDNVLCAGNDRTLRFIDDVLDEVARLFPSEYIHVGGDECPKTKWKQCAKCQARIKAEGLEADGGHTAEERLQSYVIRHAEAHLASLGKKMIGWDETLEGGLAPNATVMSWRGEGGGIEAAKQHHNVIMTPNTYLYFDYYQSDTPADEPEAIGGYLPLSHVYSYEPVPASLTPDEAKYIIGVQANLWTEYIPSFRQIEYMELPRMAALAETQWCDARQKDYSSFLKRLQRLVNHYRLANYNFCKVVYNARLSLSADTLSHAVLATLSTIDGADVHYTLDGTAPTVSSPKYTAPIRITAPCTLRADAFRSWGKAIEVKKSFTFSKSTACPVTLLQRPDPKQTYGGAALLTDGLQGENTNYASGRWIGFCGNDLEAVVDLGKEQSISSASVNVCVAMGYWIVDARSFEVLASADGKEFRLLAKEEYAPAVQGNPDYVIQHKLSFAPTSARYVKFVVTSEKSLPAWHSGHGHHGYVFVDELTVE